MKSYLKILLIVLGLFIVVGVLFIVLSTLKKGQPVNSSTKPPSAKPAAEEETEKFDFEESKSNDYYVVYFHPADEKNAQKTLDLLNSAVQQFYKKYLKISPPQTPVYLATTVDEYVKISDFPGGSGAVKVGDGSAPGGKIFLYKPFDDPTKGEGVIIHEGSHAAIYSFLGGGQNMEKFPGFLNEGIAYVGEYFHNNGEDFDPIKASYFADTLKRAANTGNPALMSLAQLGTNCEGYISEQNRDSLCRGQGTFTIWYMLENYGNDFWGKFLDDLKNGDAWQKSIEKVSGKNLEQLNQEILADLKNRLK